MKRSKNIFPFVVIAIFLLLMFNWTMSIFIHQRKEVIVPAIEGKSLLGALETISQFNLGLRKEDGEFHPNLPHGAITRQDPPSGMVVREGKIIKVTISQGSELMFVPSIIEKTVRNAELEIRRYHLEVGSKTEVYSLKYTRGRVILQIPDPDSIVEENTPVNFVVSLGKPQDGTILMPDFIGGDIKKVKNWAKKNKIDYEITEEYQPFSSKKIISQEPFPDAVIVSSSVVELVVATGEEYRFEEYIEGEKFHYEVPQGARQQKIEFILIDDTGERKILSEMLSPGSKIDIPLPATKGKAKMRIFINNILVEEREL